MKKFYPASLLVARTAAADEGAIIRMAQKSRDLRAQGLFDIKISGLSPKQQQDAINIAISSLGYFACPDGQRGKIKGMPIYVDKKWTLLARCGVT